MGLETGRLAGGGGEGEGLHPRVYQSSSTPGLGTQEEEASRARSMGLETGLCARGANEAPILCVFRTGLRDTESRQEGRLWEVDLWDMKHRETGCGRLSDFSPACRTRPGQAWAQPPGTVSNMPKLPGHRKLLS